MPSIQYEDSSGNAIKLSQFGKKLEYQGPPDISEETAKTIHQNKFQDDDIIILSYPRSGCQWLWEMTRMLIHGSCDVPVVPKQKYMLESAPKGEIETLEPPRIFITHATYDQLPQKVQKGKIRLIFLYRNPKDVAVSFYNHHTNTPQYEYKGTFNDYLQDLFIPGKVDFGEYFQYHESWEKEFKSLAKLRSNCCFISYEDLQGYTQGELQRLAQFLGLKSAGNVELLGEIAEKCSNKALRQRSKTENEAQDDPSMYKKGRVGVWRNWMTVAQSDNMDRLIKKKMKDSMFKIQCTI